MKIVIAKLMRSVLVPFILILVVMGCTSYHDSSDTYYQEQKKEELSVLENEPKVWIDQDRAIPTTLDGTSLDSPPVLLKHEVPEYPILALRAGIDGFVVFALVVGADGLVKEIETVTSNVTPAMEWSAEDTIRKYEYSPGTRDGQAVASRVEMAIYYNIE